MSNKPKKSINEIVDEKYPEFRDVVVSLSVEELKLKLAALASEYEDVCECMEGDEDLETALTTAREMGAPYRDSKKVIKIKNKYLVGLIKEKGGG